MNAERSRKPEVSIIMPARNAERFIDTSIASVRAQTHGDWELIAVDDASTDQTVRIVGAHAAEDGRIQLIRRPEQGGPGPARNQAFAAARGEYIAFLDSDDLWLPQKLERQLAFMRASDIAFSFHEYAMIDESGRDLGRRIRVPESVDYRLLLRQTIIAPVTVMLHRARVGPLEMPDLPQHEDLVLWYSILKRGIVAQGMGDDLARYRIVGNSASRNKWRSARRMWNVYRRSENLGLAESAICYAHYAWNAWRKYR